MYNPEMITILLGQQGKRVKDLAKYLSGNERQPLSNITKNEGFKDAKNEDLQYSVSGSSYTLTGSDAEGNTVTSNGSAAAETQG